MNELVQHLIHEHLPQIAAQSLMDCHVRGLHSIMLIDAPERRVRLFVTTPDHELWRNGEKTLGSLAAHSHHCAITLRCVKGALINLEYYKCPKARYTAYHYRSGILHEQGGFTPAAADHCVALNVYRRIGQGETLFMPAEQIHSVGVKQGQVAAWFVYEGREDAGYTSLSYSDQPLEQADFSGLYKPMSEERVIDLLQLAELL